MGRVHYFAGDVAVTISEKKIARDPKFCFSILGLLGGLMDFKQPLNLNFNYFIQGNRPP